MIVDIPDPTTEDYASGWKSSVRYISEIGKLVDGYEENVSWEAIDLILDAMRKIEESKDKA